MAQCVIKEVREQTLKARRTFDAALDRILKGINLIGQKTLDAILAVEGFNVKRLAFYMSKRNKKMPMETAAILKSRFGSYGGLILHRHII